MTWLEDLINQHKDMESPHSFWMWSGLVSISAVVKDNVWISRGGKYNLYPNIYCILHADSGLKKGPPISLANDLVGKVSNTRLIHGRASIQAILKKLESRSHSAPGGKIITTKSSGFICASELSSALVEDNASLNILTDLYDRNYNKEKWESILKMEEFNLEKPTVTLFGGINAAHADDFFKSKDIKGGFFARTFIVYENKRSSINSLARRGIPVDTDRLVRYLKELANLSGPFKEFADENNELTEVGQYYDDWYHRFERERDVAQVKDETGTLNRFGDSVVKIAMLISLSKRPELEIDMESMQEAIAIGEKLIGNVRRTTYGKVGSKSAKDEGNTARKAVAMEELIGRDDHKITRTQLLKKFWMQGNSDEWDVCIGTLEQAGFVSVYNIGNQTIIHMTDQAVKEIESFLKGKNK
jgi:hypothetical protein